MFGASHFTKHTSTRFFLTKNCSYQNDFAGAWILDSLKPDLQAK
jgi:hypothetical protein